MKKCFSCVFAILLAVVFLSVDATAEDHLHIWNRRTCTICGESKEVLQSGPWSYILWEETNEIEITGYDEEETEIAIPEQINGIPVTSIGDFAFLGCQNLISITMPDSVTSIGDKAFYFCGNLTSITMPDSVTSIGDEAFSNCYQLASITIPDSVTSIGINPFVCSPVEIQVSAEHPSLAVIDGVLFEKESKRLVTYPWGKEAVAVYDIPQGTLEIGDYAFYDCNPAFFTIPDSVTSIGDYAFYDCNIICIAIPDNVASIGDYAFGNCTLFSVTIPDSVTSIGNNPFLGISLKINVSINHPAFAVIDNVLFEKATKRLITYGSYEFSYDIPQGIQEIGAGAFYECINLTSVTIPDSVTCISDEAFSGCSRLAGIIIPDGVTYIGDKAFLACDDLTDITIPDSVITIGKMAFSGCYGLDSIMIPASVTSIGDRAFLRCENLTAVVAEHSYAEQYCIDNNISYTYSDNLK